MKFREGVTPPIPWDEIKAILDSPIPYANSDADSEERIQCEVCTMGMTEQRGLVTSSLLEW
jgi:hypothetical protein